MENITRGPGWHFLGVGRRIERSIQLVDLFRAIIVPLSPRTWPTLEMLLEVADSSMTYRSRYFTVLQAAPVLDLLMNDEANPRSLAFQLQDLMEHCRRLSERPSGAGWPISKQRHLEEAAANLFGADVRTLDVPVARPLMWNGLRLNHEQLIIAVVALSAMVVVAFILKRTRLGRAMRAISDDPDLAEVRGIGRAATVDWTWAISGVLTALAGVLIALDGVVDPMMGTNYLVSVFAAAVIGGIGNPFGAVAGALIIGLVEETSALAVSTTYRQGVSFAVLVLVLLLRPQGLVGAARIRR